MRHPSRTLVSVLTLGSLAVLASTAALAATPTDSQRFAPRFYDSGGRQVVVEAASDLLVVRTRQTLDRELVTQLAATALARVASKQSDASSVRIGAVRLLQKHGLFLVELRNLATRPVLLGLVDELQRSDRVLQVYPVLKRVSGRAFYDDHLVLTAQPGQLQRVLDKVLPLLDARLERLSLVPDTALLQIGRRFAFDAVEASAWLATHGDNAGLVSAEPNLYRERRPTRTVDDPIAPQQWHLYRSSETLDPSVPGEGQIFALRAWDVTLGDPSIVIAIVDTGIDYRHPDLAPNMVAGFDAADDDNDPDAECSDSPDGASEAADCPTDKPYRESHGTATSGLAAGAGNNGIGISGVCPHCSIMPIRFLGSSDATGDLTAAEIFVRAADNGAAIISNSWGMWTSRYFPQSRSEHDAYRYARFEGRNGLGTLILFAAGNETSNVANDANARSVDVMAIAASTNLDDWAYYSNYGEAIDVAAPSAGGIVAEDSYGIVTTDVRGADGYNGEDYAYDFSGTSASCPIAAGAAGLILSANPNLTADQVRIALTSTADKIHADKVDWPNTEVATDIDSVFAYDEIGHSWGFGWGRIDVGQAVLEGLQPSLQGALCTATGCQDCDPDDRCRLICVNQSECPDGSVCRGGRCDTPQPAPGTVGTDCTVECVACVWAIDDEYNPTELCTQTCEKDEECPGGWDCRLLADGELRVCAIGNPHAGEHASTRNCFSDLIFGSVLTLGDDGQAYCSEVCFTGGEDECPYGFHCSAASCTCTVSGNYGCREYTCSETSSFNPEDWPFLQCFPNSGFGITCQRDEDCGVGDYCRPDGTCRIDDRAGCPVCAPCETAADCGPLGSCRALEDGSQRCALLCEVNDACPGDSVCREVTFPSTHFASTQRVCVSPNNGANGEWCDPAYQCTVACRDDVACPTGLVCDQGACVAAPIITADGGSNPGTVEGGCGCTTSNAAAPAGWMALVLGLLLGRRRSLGQR